MHTFNVSTFPFYISFAYTDRLPIALSVKRLPENGSGKIEARLSLSLCLSRRRRIFPSDFSLARARASVYEIFVSSRCLNAVCPNSCQLICIIFRLKCKTTFYDAAKRAADFLYAILLRSSIVGRGGKGKKKRKEKKRWKKAIWELWEGLLPFWQKNNWKEVIFDSISPRFNLRRLKGRRPRAETKIIPSSFYQSVIESNEFDKQRATERKRCLESRNYAR